MLTAEGWSPRSIQAGAGVDELWFGDSHVPVLDREQLSISAWVIGAGAAVRVFWYDANGGGIGGNTSTVTATAGTPVRSWMTLTPPQNAASLRVRATNATRGTQPAVTRGAELYPWADGRGCDRAVVNAVGAEVVLSAPDRGAQFESLSFTVTEVG